MYVCMYVCACMQLKEGDNARTNNALFYALFFLATVSRGGICTEAFVGHETRQQTPGYVCMYVCTVCMYVCMYVCM